MAEKKAVKKAVKKTVKAVAKKSVARSVKKVVKKGEVFKCGVCGIAVSVNEVCGCVDICDLICCEKPMKLKKRF